MSDSSGKRRFRQAMLAAVLGLACASGAPATSFFVNNYFEDAHDLVIDGVCDATSGSHFCTLRAAIEEAAASGAADTIFLGTGTTTLTMGPLPDQYKQGSLTLVGNGHGRSSIVGASSAGGRMINSYGPLVLRGLRIAGFDSGNSSAVEISGGGSLWVEDALFEQNHSDCCGASIRASDYASLIVRNSAFVLGDGGLGGEIDVLFSSFACTGCRFEGATGFRGGALHVLEPIDVRIESSLFTGNRALGGGGAIYFDFVDQGASPILILNSTIAGNATEGYGGGVWAFGTNLRIQSSTIVGNVANSELSGGERGGGIAAGVGSSMAVANSIVSGNLRCSAGNHQGGCTAYTADDCSGSIDSNGFNIVRTVLAAQCTITGGHSAADPLLLPLAYNGGSTRTCGISPASPARGAGNPAGCQDGLAILLHDQRGAPRPAPGAGLCDLGAFEYGALIFDDDFELWEWKWSDVAP